jgi:DNA modification methylase
MKLLPDDSIDLTVTSPPYDNLRTYKGYVFDFEAIAKELYRVTKPGGVVVWVVGDATIDGSETGTSFRQALYFKEIGFNLHDTMIWEKTGSGAFGSVLCYAQNFEYMFVFSKRKPNAINLIKDRENVVTFKCLFKQILVGQSVFLPLLMYVPFFGQKGTLFHELFCDTSNPTTI